MTKNIIIIIISVLAIVGFVNASETYTKATRDRTMTITGAASSTLSATLGAATSTFYLGNPSFATYISKVYCITDVGTTTIALKHTASTTATIACDPTGEEGTVSNSALTARELLKMEVGTISTTTNQVSVTITSRDN